MNLLFADAETYFDSKTYTLRKMSVTQYVRDERFKAHGFGFCGLEGEPVWVSGPELPAYLAKIDWANTAIVAHNTKFDGAILAWKYGVKPAMWIDTQSMARAVLGASVHSHSLRTLAEKFGLMQKGEMKTDGKRDLTPDEERELAEYNRGDLIICRDLYGIFFKDFPKSQYWQMDWTIRAFVEPILVLNGPLLEEVAAKEDIRREEIIKASGIEKTDLSSNPKFQKILEANGYECPMKPSPKVKEENGNPKMIPALALGDEDFLDMLESEDEKLRAFCEARVAAKSTLLVTRARKLAAISKSGAFPFDVQLSGAKQTHRDSGGGAAGGNPQNFSQCQDPDEHKKGHFCNGQLRKCIEAPVGHKIAVGDFARVEAVITAYLAGDKNMIAALAPGRDIYCEFGTKHYGRPITKADISERKFSKTAVLGLGYNMGPPKFVKNVRVKTGQVIDEDTARKAVELFRLMYPSVEKYWYFLQGLLSRMAAGEQGFLPRLPAVRFDGPKFILPSGLEIRYPDLQKEGKSWTYFAYRERKSTGQRVNIYGGKMLENLAQGLAGELCKEATYNLRDEGFPAGRVHDEILLVAPDAWADEAAEAMTRVMSQSPAWWPELKVSAEVGVAQDWFSAKH